jgi:hypothetical protein
MYDFSPLRDRCRLFPSANAPADQAEQIDLKKLKAIFFLRELAETAPADSSPTHPPAGAPSQGRKIEVLFADKECLHGTTTGYSRERLGFFMVPEDPTGRILRVFVINANAQQIKWL